MVLSLSPGPAPVEKAFHLKQNANMWRMSGDFWDSGDALDRMFALCEKWYAHVSPGCWPDCDMLPLGVLQLTERDQTYRARKTRFTANEQKTVMNLWCMFRSPLMMGGELTMLDDFTFGLLTNRELIAVNQRSSGNRPLVSTREKAVWTCTDENGNDILALFNLLHAPQTVEYTLPEAPGSLCDLWTGEKIFPGCERICVPLGPRESRVFRLHK